jgi:hypothetical protein
MRTLTGFHAFSLVALACAALFVASDASAGPIRKRKENQQDRIAQGVKSGQLTAGETARLEKKEARLNAETRDMREDNGGKLTAAEKRRVNRQQDRLSRDIYRQKHDGQTQPQ